MDYAKIYKLFDDCSPLKADCGLLCEKRCCRGDENTGMLLFPGEETALTVKHINGKRLAVCDGSCDRTQRPLSCRIFPFFPVINGKGKITVSPDYRGLAVCPLLSHRDEVIFDRRFLRRVKKAGKLLKKDRECADFLKEISGEIADEQRLCGLFE